jgi:uncharacterized protein YdeI (YjbR/CyaY-like superfamily)
MTDDDSVAFGDVEEWRAWLADGHTTSSGVWMRIAKTGSGIPSVTYKQALDQALRHGWIDAQKKSVDSDWWLQRFVPRGPRSKWSKVNRERCEELIDLGELTPAGLAAVEQARADGRWDAAYDPPSRSVVPPDLQEALDAAPAAAAFFATLTSQNRYAILHRIQDAKRPATRAARIEKFVQMLMEGKTLH